MIEVFCKETHEMVRDIAHRISDQSCFRKAFLIVAIEHEHRRLASSFLEYANGAGMECNIKFKKV